MTVISDAGFTADDLDDVIVLIAQVIGSVLDGVERDVALGVVGGGLDHVVMRIEKLEGEHACLERLALNLELLVGLKRYRSELFGVLERERQELEVFRDLDGLGGAGQHIAIGSLCLHDCVGAQGQVLFSGCGNARIVGNERLDDIVLAVVDRELGSDELLARVGLLGYAQAAANILVVVIVEEDHFLFYGTSLVFGVIAPADGHDLVGFGNLEMVFDVREDVARRRFGLTYGVFTKWQTCRVICPADICRTICRGNHGADRGAICIEHGELGPCEVLRASSILLFDLDATVGLVIHAHDGKQVLLGGVP